jgi:hypothetical protein
MFLEDLVVSVNAPEMGSAVLAATRAEVLCWWDEVMEFAHPESAFEIAFLHVVAAVLDLALSLG